jgi:hypothetical protein
VIFFPLQLSEIMHISTIHFASTLARRTVILQKLNIVTYHEFTDRHDKPTLSVYMCVRVNVDVKDKMTGRNLNDGEKVEVIFCHLIARSNVEKKRFFLLCGH